MKKIVWHKFASDENEIVFGQNGIAVIDVEGKKICLARHDNEFFAFAFKCPHAGGIMADGFIDALGNVVCPLHRYKFSIKNGRNTSGEGFYLKTWSIQNRPDGLYIGMEEGGFFSWLK